MYNKTSVKVFEGFGHLVNDKTNVNVLKDILGYDVVQIGLHELEYQVDVLVVIGS